jgi:hypothetical protein
MGMSDVVHTINPRLKFLQDGRVASIVDNDDLSLSIVKIELEKAVNALCNQPLGQVPDGDDEAD